MKIASLIILLISLLFTNTFLYGGEEVMGYIEEGRVMLRPAGKVIFDFRPHREGFIVVIANYGDKDFTFQPDEIMIRQRNKIWRPLYITVAPDAVKFPLQFSSVHLPTEIRKYGRTERITISGGDWQTLEDLQIDIKGNTAEGLKPFCYLALEDPLPDFTRPIEIRLKRDRKIVTFQANP